MLGSVPPGSPDAYPVSIRNFLGNWSTNIYIRRHRFGYNSGCPLEKWTVEDDCLCHNGSKCNQIEATAGTYQQPRLNLQVPSNDEGPTVCLHGEPFATTEEISIRIQSWKAM
jgi:hypothetical protein